ncbi:hypothetical protein MKW94_030803 [Papaver nudicaule]|uniref:Importin subunit beta-1/Transportin-1-like TPR repeats domain-containing protein n=1 Tax=Papaver nudicaule TaxID=74823 RepID=A0AA42B2R5_PAPNU|nr:hypothetical protein [Papaver nudicaule]
MMLLLKVFGCGSSTGYQEAMLWAVAHATGSEFGKYMPKFYKYLEMGLQNFNDYQILPFCDGIMSHLFTGLSSGVIHCSVTPLIFSCFGDIGIAIGEHFEKYLPSAMLMIQAAYEICTKMDSDNEEMMNYNYQLRCGIFDAYSGILQGLKNSKAELMLPYAGHLLQFIEFVFRDKTREESVSKAAVVTMGDLASTLGPNMKILFKDRAFYADFLRETVDSNDYKMKEITVWTQRMIKRVF